MNSVVEDRAGLYQIGLGELMGWVALAGVCLTAARAAPPLGVAAACLLVPAQARTFHRAGLRKSGEGRPGFGGTLVELARSMGLVLRAYFLALMSFFASTIVFGCLLYILIAFAALAASIVRQELPRFAEPGYAVLAGALLGLPGAPIVFFRTLFGDRKAPALARQGP